MPLILDINQKLCKSKIVAWCPIFQAYEKGIALFRWPNVFDLWNTYLSKFIDRYVSTLYVYMCFVCDRYWLY